MSKFYLYYCYAVITKNSIGEVSIRRKAEFDTKQEALSNYIEPSVSDKDCYGTVFSTQNVSDEVVKQVFKTYCENSILSEFIEQITEEGPYFTIFKN